MPRVSSNGPVAAWILRLLPARALSTMGWVLLWIGWPLEPAEGALLRGPYLQLGTPTSVMVRWRTDLAGVGRVRYGTNVLDLPASVDEPAATTNHQVTLTGLLPDAVYFYSVGDTSQTLAGGPDYFVRTAPATGSQRPIRIWVLGDSGYTNRFASPVRDAYYNFTGSRHTDVWLMLGDNAYTGGGDAIYQHAVFDTYPSMLGKTVLWSTIGNQETAGSSSPPATLPYFEMFSFPTNAEAGGVASGTEKYYSFDYGNVHFICLDSMSSTRTAGGPMLQWLEADLSATTNPWVIAFWHHPPYSKGSNDSDVRNEQIQMRTNAVRLLEAHGVDLVLCGHSHSYERSWLIDGHYGLSTTFTPLMVKDGGDGRLNGSGAYRKSSLGVAPRQGAVYVVAGSGSSLGGGTLNHPAMYRSLNQLGSLVLDIQANRLDATFVRETGAVDDYFTLLKGSEPFELLSVAVTQAVATLQWRSVAKRTYRVESSPSAASNSWQDASGALQASSHVTTWTAPAPSSPPRRFYRVWSQAD